MKNESSLKILEALEDMALAPFDLFCAITESGYGASARTLENNLYKIKSKRDEARYKREVERKRRALYNSLVYKLKRDGLIKEVLEKGKKKYAITPGGEVRLEKLRKNENFPWADYKKEEGGKIVIAIFDIPEKDRKKRAWLRGALKNIGLSMAQQSVWIGKVHIPKEFIEDLFIMGLEEYVEIFEVGKTGNLKALM